MSGDDETNVPATRDHDVEDAVEAISITIAELAAAVAASRARMAIFDEEAGALLTKAEGHIKSVTTQTERVGRYSSLSPTLSSLPPMPPAPTESKSSDSGTGFNPVLVWVKRVDANLALVRTELKVISQTVGAALLAVTNLSDRVGRLERVPQSGPRKEE